MYRHTIITNRMVIYYRTLPHLFNSYYDRRNKVLAVIFTLFKADFVKTGYRLVRQTDVGCVKGDLGKLCLRRSFLVVIFFFVW